MKYKIYLLIIPVLFGSLNSCKKSFLDVENTTDLYRQVYVKDLASMKEFMDGIYIMLNSNFSCENGLTISYPELVADNLKVLASGAQALLAHYNWTQTAGDMFEINVAVNSTSMNGAWTSGYQIIRACSFVIEDVSKYRNENPVLADDIKGQAFAMRAMIHTKLVNIFAQSYAFASGASHPGIPYITTSDIAQPFSRQTVAEVYAAIIDDFNNAIQLLPATIADTRYMNLAAAKALLARVYLFKEDYANAKTLALEISNQFPLLTIARGYPIELFKEKKPAESEILFRLTPENLGSTGTSSFPGRLLMGSNRRFTATKDIADILQENPGDIRNTWVTETAMGSGIWNVIKYPTAVTPEIIPAISLIENAYYHPIIRSSEMFLIVAEASAKTGDENTAKTYLNAVRKRANPSIASVTATGGALLDSIYKERRKELAFEGMRMYDLQRWKLGVHRVDALSTAPKDLPYPSDKAIAPIPLRDVRQEGLQQNPGY